MADYKFYMKTCKPNNAGVKKDLEADFLGMKYIEAKKINDKGALKTVYKESFVEKQGTNVYIGQHPTRKETEVSFSFIFMGNATQRQQVYNAFVDFINSGTPILYYDTARRKYVYLVYEKELSPSDDIVKDEYMICTFAFTNIFGDSFDAPLTTAHPDSPWLPYDETRTTIFDV